jgi:hypothetical protein
MSCLTQDFLLPAHGTWQPIVGVTLAGELRKEASHQFQRIFSKKRPVLSRDIRYDLLGYEVKILEFLISWLFEMNILYVFMFAYITVSSCNSK